MPDPTREELVEAARTAAKKYGIDPNYFIRQINAESGFQPAVTSSAGAQGIAQIMPNFHPGVDTADPYASLDYAANLMSNHLKNYGGDWSRALWAYNAGPGNVQKGILPAETKRYIELVLGGAAMPYPGEKKANVTGTPKPPKAPPGSGTRGLLEAGAGEGYLDPVLNPNVLDQLFPLRLGQEDPLALVMRGLSRGGAPIFGGPQYMTDIAKYMTLVAQLSSLFQGGSSLTPPTFPETLQGIGGAGPDVVNQLVRSILLASQGRSNVEGAQNVARGSAGFQEGAGGLEALDTFMRGGGQALDEDARQLEARGGPGIANLMDATLQNPETTRMIAGLLGYGRGAGGAALQNYVEKVILPYYSAFQSELYPSYSNPLKFLAAMLEQQRG